MVVDIHYVEVHTHCNCPGLIVFDLSIGTKLVQGISGWGAYLTKLDSLPVHWRVASLITIRTKSQMEVKLQGELQYVTEARTQSPTGVYAIDICFGKSGTPITLAYRDVYKSLTNMNV
jgi:hypothetical protein